MCSWLGTGQCELTAKRDDLIVLALVCLSSQSRGLWTTSARLMHSGQGRMQFFGILLRYERETVEDRGRKSRIIAGYP